MDLLQQRYTDYLEKRRELEELSFVQLAEIQRQETALLLSQTSAENFFGSWMLSKAYKEKHHIEERQTRLAALQQQERTLLFTRDALLAEITKLQEVLPSIVLLSETEVRELEALLDRIQTHIVPTQTLLEQLIASISSTRKKTTTGMIAEGADLLLERRRNGGTKGILSRVADVASTLLSQRTFATNDEINQQIVALQPLIEEINALREELAQAKHRQDAIDDRKKPLQDLRQIKDYRVVEYVDLLQDVIFPSAKYDVGSMLSLTTQFFVQKQTKELLTQITQLQRRLAEIQSGAHRIRQDITLYRSLSTP